MLETISPEQRQRAESLHRVATPHKLHGHTTRKFVVWVDEDIGYWAAMGRLAELAQWARVEPVTDEGEGGK